MSVIHSTAIELLESLGDKSVGAVVSDPPYEISFRKWDDTGLIFQGSFWAEISRVLKDEGVAIVLGHPRVSWKMAAAAESAGLVVGEQIAWVNTPTFPKAPGLLKAAWESIYCFKKSGQRISFDVESERVAYADAADAKRTQARNPKTDGLAAAGTFGASRRQHVVTESGRKPSNVILDDQEHFGSPARYFNRARQGSKHIYCPNGVNPHPTAKPVDLMRWLVRLAVPRSAQVVDPFVGSGATGIACALEDRDFVGCDIDRSYVDIANARIAAAKEEAAR